MTSSRASVGRGGAAGGGGGGRGRGASPEMMPGGGASPSAGGGGGCSPTRRGGDGGGDGDGGKVKLPLAVDLLLATSSALTASCGELIAHCQQPNLDSPGFLSLFVCAALLLRGPTVSESETKYGNVLNSSVFSGGFQEEETPVLRVRVHTRQAHTQARPPCMR